MKNIKSILTVSILIEIVFMFILKQVYTYDEFWRNVIISIITGLPIGLLTGYITGYYLTKSINNTLQAEALKFYKTLKENIKSIELFKVKDQ